MLARQHGHLSNRARVRERKPVFKSVLENPFQLAWPSVPLNVQNSILARLVAALENVPPRAHASRKIAQEAERSGNVMTPEELNHDVHSNSSRLEAGSSSSVSPPVIIGINDVTRALESQLSRTRQRVVVDNHSPKGDRVPPPPPSPIVVVFACYADVDPAALIDHIPYLVAGCNSPRNVTQLIKLVPLPKGSEQTISQILGIRRSAVIALRRGSPIFETVESVLDPVPIISAPWLCPSDTPDDSRLVPTHIKQLRTTAPKDMRSAREQRARARAAAKKSAPSSSRSVRRKPRVTLTTGSEGSA